MQEASLEALQVFITVIREGSFTSASRYLGIPASTVSRKISQLEKCLGCRLLIRSTRRLQLTETGQRYFHQCAAGLDAIEAANRELQKSLETPEGLLRITAPINLASSFLSPHFADFSVEWPTIRLDIDLTNDFPSFLDQSIDVAFVGGELPDSDLIARPIGRLRYGLYASHHYLRERGTPEHPDQLSGHDLIMTWPLKEWRLTHPGGAFIRVQKPPRISVNEMFTAVIAAGRGLGVVNLPHAYVAMHKDKVPLTPLLPEWEGACRTLSMIYHSREHLPRRVRLFMDFMQERLHPILGDRRSGHSG